MHYTKKDLENIVLAQLDNLNSINELVEIMRKQNELIAKANEKMEREVRGLREYVRCRKEILSGEERGGG